MKIRDVELGWFVVPYGTMVHLRLTTREVNEVVWDNSIDSLGSILPLGRQAQIFIIIPKDRINIRQ